jgi:hypothetical protein
MSDIIRRAASVPASRGRHQAFLTPTQVKTQTRCFTHKTFVSMPPLLLFFWENSSEMQIRGNSIHLSVFFFLLDFVQFLFSML